MTDDKEKTFKRDVIERLNKAKGRLQQSVPEIRQLIKASDVVETARQIIDPKNIKKISGGLKKLADANLPHAIIKQAVVDFQLKDLFAKAEALVAKANLSLAKMFSKDTLPTETPTSETSSNETPKEARLKKTPPKETSVKKTVSKKTLSKKKAKPTFKRKVSQYRPDRGVLGGLGKAQPMATEFVTAIEMANAAGVNQKTFRQALRDQRFSWHSHNEPWVVQKDSPKHRDMCRVLATLTGWK